MGLDDGERVSVDVVSPLDVERVTGIVRGLPEWFTPSAAAEVEEDAGRSHGFVVRVDGVVRGFVLLDERECCMEILWLAVERGFQGRGLGSMLLEASAGYACSRGKRILSVKTYGGMDYEPYLATLKFYRDRGFRLYEVIEEYKPFGGQPAAILLKHLDCTTTAESPE